VTVERALEETATMKTTDALYTAPQASETERGTTGMMIARDAEVLLPGLNTVMIEMTDDLLTVLLGVMTAGNDATTAPTGGETTETDDPMDATTETDEIQEEETIEKETGATQEVPVHLPAKGKAQLSRLFLCASIFTDYIPLHI
jgi:hypothetical protein